MLQAQSTARAAKQIVDSYICDLVVEVLPIYP
jgi:hypothetical protein